MGRNLFRQFDDEFAIAIFDLEKQQVTISTDQFAIKPMWIMHAPDAGSFGVSTYKSALLRAGHVEAHIAEAEPNIVAVYSFESDPQRRGRPTMFRHVRSERLYAWDLRQHKTEIEAWERAFEEAVRRRTAGAIHPVFLPLSDGYDSGAIHLALHRLGVPHTTYTVGLNTEQVSARLKYGKSSAAAQYVVRLTEGDFREVSSDLKERCEPLHLSFGSVVEPRSTPIHLSFTYHRSTPIHLSYTYHVTRLLHAYTYTPIIRLGGRTQVFPSRVSCVGSSRMSE
jgi:asparagine synthetase B (glutamine-hydrolysing)